jgi:uncharacterized protein YndB with AHSA1/START domain
MRWFINVLKALGVLLLLLLVVAYLLPDHRTVSRSREIAATPEQIWPQVVDPRRWSAWSPWYAKDPAMKMSYTGPASGAGAQWSWESSTQGQGSMRFERAEAPRLLAYSLRFEDMDSTATGEIRLEPTGSGSTRVEWTFETRLGANPLMRWFGIGLDTMVGKDFEVGLARLAQVVAQP